MPRPPAPDHVLVRLDHGSDWSAYRQAARQLLARGIQPEQLIWRIEDAPQGDDLFAQAACPLDTAAQSWLADGPPELSPASHRLSLPRELIELCQDAFRHAEPQRLGLIYRFLWRLRQQPALRHDPLDGDLLHLRQLQRAVRREQHKMKAFVRFRPLSRPDLPPLQVAWFEPEHQILEAVAPFFQCRYFNMDWAILTPSRCVQWLGRTLSWSAGARREQAPPADAGEALWLTYYAHIFNPARLKTAMMRQEMPVKYWRNLPEARLISELTANAGARSAGMLAAAPTTTRRRLRPGAGAPAPESDQTPASARR